MNQGFLPEQLTRAIAHAQQRAREQGGDASGASAPMPFAIAFSRETGTYGAAIAREVSNRLGWPLYDRELLQRIAEDMGVHRSLLESVDERSGGWLQESLSSFFETREVSEFAYFRRLVETLLSLAAHGECVVVGRGATIVLPLATTLRVRVVAPLEHRIRAVQRERSITIAEATSEIETKDRQRRQFIKEHFQIDPTVAENYDLVLNSARLTIRECADLVVAALDRFRSHSRSSVASHDLHATAK